MSQTPIDLTPIVRSIERMGNQLGHDIDAVSNQVGRVSHDLDVTNQNLLDLRARFEEYVEMQTRANLVAQAKIDIVGLKAEMDREFGKYQVVRDSTIGTLQAMDIGIVTKQTVQQVAEELMIQLPKYWLAPAIVAIAAWIRDDQEIARKGVDESYSRDATKCSLLFTLILARQGRLEASSHWLKHYFTGLDPENLPRDFAVIMEGAAREAFGSWGKSIVEHQLAEWLGVLREDQSRVRAQIEIWRKEISNQRSVVNRNNFPTLSKLSPTWQTIQAQLCSASALGNTRDKYVAIRDSSAELSLSLRDQMDDLLERLVTEYDEAELPTRRKIVRTQAIIDTDGDLKRANQQADELQVALEERIDALTMQSYTAIAPDLLGVSVSTQQVSIGAAKTEFREAVTNYTTTYRASATQTADIVLDSTHSNYATQYKFPGCQVSTSWPQQKAEDLISSTWASTIQAIIDDLTWKATKLIVPIIIALIAIVIGFAVNPIAGVIILLLGAGGVGLYGYFKKQSADKEIARVREAGKAATDYSISMYRTAVGEFVDAQMAYEDADAKESALLEMIDGWHSAITSDEA